MFLNKETLLKFSGQAYFCREILPALFCKRCSKRNAAVVKNKPELFSSDVTGNYFAYTAVAIGENDEKIKEKLREEYKQSISIEDGIRLSMKIFKELLGKNFELRRFDVAYVKSQEMGVVRISEDGLKKYVK